MEMKWKSSKAKSFIFKGKFVLLCILPFVFFAGCSIKENKEVINISAAASLTEVLPVIGEMYTEQNEKVELRFNFAGSQVLKTQIEQGSQADIFISANEKYASALEEEQLFFNKTKFTQNELCFIVNNKHKNIDELSDIRNEGVSVIIGDEGVPVGKYTRQVLKNLEGQYGEGFKTQVMSHVVSNENSVKKVLTKVNLDEADCGFVYRTDYAQYKEHNLNLIEIPKEFNVISTYYLGMIDEASDRAKEVEDFYAFLRGKEVQEILENYGFETMDTEA